MSMFSDWTSKGKKYWDEKIKPEGGTTKKYADKGEAIAEDFNKTYRQGQYFWDTLKKGPKGTTGQIIDSLYGGTLKDWVKQAQGKSNEGESSGNTAADDKALADLNYSSRRGFQGKGTGKRVGSEDMRREPYAMNTKTLLTQGQKAKKLTA